MMRRINVFAIISIVLAACAAPQPQKAPGPAATGAPQVGMANPASVYCTQQGNKLEIRTADDGSQNGVCIFPDGSACDEWAYFGGECGLTTQKSPTPGMTVETAKKVSGGSPGSNNSIENNSGSSMPPAAEEKIAGWWGVIKSTESGAQYDDYFERQDLGQKINFGIGSTDPAVQAQIKTLRDSGKIIHLYGTLVSNVPDFNGSQIQVDRIEME